mmetsp:Transcript_29000/g.76882  ORF Transcript_29000/g.76882 Transcript_29000/m.76882 type:complete len:246 (+) Transcript_29000:394-1131(+)
MQDLVADMTVPCALSLIMGTRTATPEDFNPPARDHGVPKLLASMSSIDASAPTMEEHNAGSVTKLRYLSFLDESTSTTSLGFRIDAGKTVVGAGGSKREAETLPLPKGRTLATLKDEADIIAVLCTFLRNDASLAQAFLQKLEKLKDALSRSAFFPKHAFLRTTMLLVFDDASREAFGKHELKAELKIMNFADAYALPNGQEVDHTATWDGTAASHADGFLTGMQSVARLLEQVAKKLQNTRQMI